MLIDDTDINKKAAAFERIADTLLNFASEIEDRLRGILDEAYEGVNLDGNNDTSDRESPGPGRIEDPASTEKSFRRVGPPDDGNN